MAKTSIQWMSVMFNNLVHANDISRIHNSEMRLFVVYEEFIQQWVNRKCLVMEIKPKIHGIFLSCDTIYWKLLPKH